MIFISYFEGKKKNLKFFLEKSSLKKSSFVSEKSDVEMLKSSRD